MPQSASPGVLAALDEGVKPPWTLVGVRPVRRRKDRWKAAPLHRKGNVGTRTCRSSLCLIARTVVPEARAFSSLWATNDFIVNGGEGGIRTPVPVTRQDAFEAPPLRPLRYLSVYWRSRPSAARLGSSATLALRCSLRFVAFGARERVGRSLRLLRYARTSLLAPLRRVWRSRSVGASAARLGSSATLALRCSLRFVAFGARGRRPLAAVRTSHFTTVRRALSGERPGRTPA